LILTRIKLLAEGGLGIIFTTHHPEQALMLNSAAALLKKEGESIIGPAREILTEKNLQDAYGVPVAIADVLWNDKKLSFCQPLLIR
jgi:iron complex transport system ATP-binding protein